MALGATGTPTSLGIPKYATSADAPNGTGFNSAMDAIDSLIGALPQKPSGILSGECMVWNGTTFVRSSVTRVGPTSLGSGTPDGTKYLRDDGTWQTISSGPGYGTSLPGSPTDGQEYVLVDSLTAPTYQWRFRYNAGSASAYKWECVGVGAPLYASNDSQFTGSGGNGSPAVTVPRAGDYMIDFGCQMSCDTATGMPYQRLQVNSVDASPQVECRSEAATLGQYTTVARSARLTSVPAAAVLTFVHGRYTGNNGMFQYRWMSARPVRVS